MSDEFEEDRPGSKDRTSYVLACAVEWALNVCCTRMLHTLHTIPYTDPPPEHNENRTARSAPAPSTYVKSVAELLPERSRAANHDRVYRSTPKAPSSNARRMSIGCMQVGHTVLILIHVAAQSA